MAGAGGVGGGIVDVVGLGSLEEEGCGGGIVDVVIAI